VVVKFKIFNIYKGMVVPIEYATKKESIVVGKPSPEIIDIIMKENNIKDKTKILMIGDR
jgi:ribonucleotide monophosphatase NagD (HAD superfamily)